MSDGKSSSKKIKVLQVNKFYHPVTGGIETLVKQYSEELSALDDIELEVLCCQNKRAKTEVETINGVKVTRMSSLGTYFSCPLSIPFIFRFWKEAKDADVVEMHVPFPLVDFATTFSRSKAKFIIHWHSDIVKQEKVMFLVKPFMNAMLKKSSSIIVATKGHILGSKYLPPYENKCKIIPYGVDTNEFNPSKIKDGLHDILTSKLTQKDSKKALFVGRLVYYKGVEVLVNAMKDVTDTELFICGSGPLSDDLKAKTKELGLDSKIHFLDYLNDQELKAAYNDCDFFVLPSIQRSEAFAIVQIEAMAYGKPVINTRLDSGVPYVSLDGETGITVTPNSSAELAAAINTLAHDSEICSKYGTNAKRRVEDIFSEPKIINALYELIKSE